MEQTQTTVSVTDMVRKIAEYDGWEDDWPLLDYYNTSMDWLHPVAVRVYQELTKSEDTELKNGANPEKWDSIMLCIHAIKDALLQPISTGKLLKAVYNGICLLEKYNTPE